MRSSFHFRGSRLALTSFAALAAAVGASAAAEETFYAVRVAPILEKNCVVCHGEKKQKAKLRLDRFDLLMKGGEDGEVVKAGDPKGSDLYRRITLPHDDEEFMPSDGKPPLKADEIKVIELWIAAGASNTASVASIKGAPALVLPKPPPPPLTPDWHARGAQIAALEKSLGIRLVPRSALATDGLVLRTASAPSRCDDAALQKLAPVADLIVEAELGRTRVTDAGLAAVAGFTNLHALDLTRTKVTPAGLAKLMSLKKLEALNLTSTGVDEAGVKQLKTLPALKGIWTFDTPATPAPPPEPPKVTAVPAPDAKAMPAAAAPVAK